MLTAEDIKAILIDYLLQTTPNLNIIISELPFSPKTKQLADLVYIQQSNTFAFEIKGAKDNLARLSKQINGYIHTFNYVFLVLHKKFFQSKKFPRIPQSVGIYIIDDNEKLTLIKGATSNTKITKQALMSMLWKQELQAEMGTLEGKKLRNKFFKLPLEQAQHLVLQKISDRYQKRFHLFIQERGTKTRTEDIKYLRVPYSLPLPSSKRESSDL